MLEKWKNKKSLSDFTLKVMLISTIIILLFVAIYEITNTNNKKNPNIFESQNKKNLEDTSS